MSESGDRSGLARVGELLGLHYAEAPTMWSFRRQALLLASLLIAMGTNIALETSGVSPSSGAAARWLGIVIVLAGLAQVAACLPKDALLAALNAGPRDVGAEVDALKPADERRRRIMMGSVVAAALLLTAAVALTGGPFGSPYGQFLVGGLILGQVLAPRPAAVVVVLVISFILVGIASAGSTWLPLDGIQEVRASWTPWHSVAPALILAFASTIVTVSQLATAAAERRTTADRAIAPASLNI